jgi:spermidine synthase
MQKYDTSSYHKLTLLIGFIFFFSGFASLIYQVVWQRLLTLHYGVGSIAITLIVSVYMFGLGVGALIGGYLAERIRQKVLLYFIVEAALGIFGIGSLSFLDVLGRYTAGTSYILSLLGIVLFLSLPTLLMGITLPLLTKYSIA